jgi:hypothetical protein
MNELRLQSVQAEVEGTQGQVEQGPSYRSPELFVIGTAVDLVQGPRNYSRLRDGFNRWYVWTY